MLRRVAFVLVLVIISSLVAAQETGESPGQAPTGQADADQADADQADAETTYTGVWSAQFGPVTLEWILQDEQYEFYAYQEQSIRIGSRGSLTVEDGSVTFVSEETTGDGEEWSEVDLPEEERSTTFALILEEEALRLAQTERAQFYVEYRSREQSVQEQAPEEESGGGADGAADANGMAPENEEQ